MYHAPALALDQKSNGGGGSDHRIKEQRYVAGAIWSLQACAG